MVSADIYLPLNLQQIIDVVRQLPKKQKQQLVDVLLEQDIAVPEQQKQLVRSRIKKYKANTGKLISEQDAWNSLNANT